MIFVTLGTNDKNFTRLLGAIHQAQEEGAILDTVIVQSGYTKYEDSKMEIHESFNQDTFAHYIQEADFIITHGGVGTIMTALKQGKRILAAARLEKYHEHVNDHQTQILEAFDKAGYLIYMRDLTDIKPYLERIKTFQPQPFVSNQMHFVSEIKDWIDHHS